MTSPNPMVGAVVEKDGKIVGEGWHQQAGGPHAEVHALRAAGEHARGGTIYVTLEPCSTLGRTPPCTDAILQAGIKKVVVGTNDPNPLHAGKGNGILRAQGIEVVENVLQQECQDLNDSFFCWIRYKRPLVLLKLAMTLDGKIATASGQSKWITGPDARSEVQRLRQWCDAIMVGGETVRQDNPQLLVREPADWPRQPLRLVATRSGGLGQAAMLTDNSGEVRLIQASSPENWQNVLEDLGREGITALLVEGGGALSGELLSAGCIDKVALFYAPILLGGKGSRSGIAGPDPQQLVDGRRMTNVNIRHIGADILITGYLSDVHRYC